MSGAQLSTVNPITGATTAVGSLVSGTPRAFAISANYDPRPVVTITATSVSRPFGSANPALTFTATGFTGGDTAASIDVPPTCTTTATASSPVGTYPITCAGASDAAYTFTYVAGTLSVVPAGTVLKLDAFLRLMPLGGQLTAVSCTLRTTAGAPVVGVPVTFRAQGQVLCTAVTNAQGAARCNLDFLGLLRVLGALGYQGQFAGNGSFAPSSGTTALIA